MRLSRFWPFRGRGLPTFDVSNVVGPGTDVRGDVRCPEGIRIDGTLRGTVESSGPIVIGVEGAVEGSVRGRNVVVLGRIIGDVYASHLEVGPQGRLLGDVTVTSVRVHEGGALHGTSRVGDVGDDLRLVTGSSESTGSSGTFAGALARVRTLPPPLGGVPPPARGAVTDFPVVKSTDAATPQAPPSVASVLSEDLPPKGVANDSR
jgi:cytoskeletal protein CcmA (bactofilin family)